MKIAARTLALVAFAASASAGEWRDDPPCVGSTAPGGLRRLAEPTPGTMRGFESPWCLKIDDDTRICDGMGAEDTAFVLARRGKIINAWQGGSGLMGLGAYTALRGDLDLDGSDELVVANLWGSSNGLGVNYWNIAIFDGRDWSRPPTRFQSEEFDVEDSLRIRDDEGRCEIFATEWNSAIDAKRGWGMYFAGQWFLYESGSLVPDDTRPVLWRRYLYSFERERGTAPRPLGWLVDERAEEVEPEKVRLGRPLRSDEATIVGAASPRIKLRFASGKSRWFDLDAYNPGPQVALGDLERGHVFPLEYKPSDSSALVGRKVVLKQYRDNGEWDVIWIAGLQAAQ